jgi:phage terminase large subunit-like protein
LPKNLATVIKELNQADLSKIIKTPEEKEAWLNKLYAYRDLDPFWTFVPNDGVLTEERRNVLRRYLKEEDIPQRVASQLDVILCNTNIIGDSGGNRSAKTTTGCIRGLIKATGEIPSSLKPYKDQLQQYIDRAQRKFIRGRVTGVNSKQLHTRVIPIWQYWIPRKYLKKGIWEESYSKEFDILTLYRNGKACANIEFMTNEQEVKSTQGGELDWAIFDEEPDADKYKETLMRFATADRLDIEIDWTPTEGLSWATELFHSGIFDGEEVKDSIALFKLTPVCNRFVKLDTLINLMDQFAKVSSYDEMKMRLLGEAISLSGLVYGSLFDQKIHVIEPFEITYKDFVVYRGLDPHLVKPTVCVEVAVDREGFEYVIGTYSKQADTEIIKADLRQRAKDRKYRLGWTRCDKSADSEIKILGGRNIFLELGRGKDAIPALFVSEKFTGSINAGVDEIKKKLKVDPSINPPEGSPNLFIFNTPENKELIKSFRTLERDAYANEDKKGMKDRIAEGKHDAHAALRYAHQYPMRWMPANEERPEFMKEESYV